MSIDKKIDKYLNEYNRDDVADDEGWKPVPGIDYDFQEKIADKASKEIENIINKNNDEMFSKIFNLLQKYKREYEEKMEWRQFLIDVFANQEPDEWYMKILKKFKLR